MTDELKQLVEDAAKLLGYDKLYYYSNGEAYYVTSTENWEGWDDLHTEFNPLDPERGDLMKVADAAKVVISYYDGWVRWVSGGKHGQEHFLCGDYQSLALAILRAASAVLKSKGGV